MQTRKVPSHHLSGPGTGVSDELTTTRVMLSEALPRSSSRPGSACAFRTALPLPGGRWFPAILKELDGSPSVPLGASRAKQESRSAHTVLVCPPIQKEQNPAEPFACFRPHVGSKFSIGSISEGLKVQWKPCLRRYLHTHFPGYEVSRRESIASS